jgi:predicted acyltransferase
MSIGRSLPDVVGSRTVFAGRSRRRTASGIEEEICMSPGTEVGKPLFQDRLMSLDVFRGATVAGMLLVNDPGTWSAVYPPLLHAPWHGWTFTDTIFPFFLWITGMAMTLSTEKRISRGARRRDLMLHALQRSIIIFAIGLFLAGFPFFRFSTIRIPGVLQRIAVCYLIATIIYLTTKIRGQIMWTGALLVVYWLLMKLYPVPGHGAGILEKDGNFAQYIDGLLLSGHMWASSKTWDPEGIISTLPAIATTLFGILTGHLLRARRSPEEKTAWIFVLGNALLFCGWVVSLWLPINKNLWTSSYAVFMAGLAANVFAFSYWIIDVRGYRKWALPFRIYGMNAIAIFTLSGLLGKTALIVKVTGSDGSQLTLWSYVFRHAFAPLATPINASLFFALAYVLLFFGIAWGMYRLKWFVKF